MFALILSGGVGTRLWPRSRSTMPKQLLPLTGARTMVQATVDRIQSIIPNDHIFFATNADYAPLIREQLPQIPAENVLAEPSAKHTAPCIGLGALHMRQVDSSEVMASLHADHFIIDEEGFRQSLLAAEALAKEGYLVTLGITPDKPETGYGYIKRGAEIGEYNNFKAYRIGQFLEKPDLPTAEKFLASGDYFWNSGIFIWQLSTLMDAYRAYLPELGEQLEQMEKAIATGNPVDPIWAQIAPKSIDVGIMEQAENTAVIPVDIGWNDVGSWDAIYDVAETNQDGIAALNADRVSFETKNSLIQSNTDRLIATVGVEDLIIVDTADALLICAMDKAQDVKKIVNWLEENNRNDLL